MEEIVRQLRAKIIQLDPDKLDRANPHAMFEHAISMGCYVLMLSELVFQKSGVDRDQLQSIPPSVLLLPVPKKEPLKA